MCPRRDHGASASSSSKRQERETRQQQKKAREKKTHFQKDENTKAFEIQLRSFNLQLRDIAGDGNCLFRSFADQMDGSQDRHRFYRDQICDYMRQNRVDFEPFIVEQSFDAFVKSLSKDGTYGGNECLVAFSRLYDARICIHQLNQPVWTVCFSESPKHEIHISYHNYEHYSSVRKLGDHTSDSANVRQQMTTCDPSMISKKPNNKKTPEKEENTSNLFDEHDIDYIQSQLTQPIDRKLICDTLLDNHGDIDGTIASLLAFESPTPIVEDLPPESAPPQSDEPIERIMSITGIFDVDLIQESFKNHHHDLDATVKALLDLNTQDDGYVDEEESSTPTTTKSKTRPISSRQSKSEKKKAKKQRAMEKHRAEIAAANASEPVAAKAVAEKSETPVVNDAEPIPLANMEFIRI